MVWLPLDGCHPYSHHSDQKAMIMHENDSLYYTVRVGELPYSDSLKIDAKGVATFLSTNNFQVGVPSEIGSYHLPLENEAVEELWRMLEAVKFEEIDTSGCRPEEGEGTRVITVVKDNKTVAKLVGQRDPAPAGYKELEEKFKEVVKQVRLHPASALRMETTFVQGEVRRGESVQVILAFSNPGQDPITFANPICMEKLKIGFLEIDALRSDIPLIELRDQHHFNLSLNQKNLVEFVPEPRKDQEALMLSPGEVVQCTLKVPINWPGGEYGVHLIYACQRAMIGEVQVFEGQIDSLSLPIKVQE